MWKVFQPQLYNYHVSGNKILTSMIFATKSLKQSSKTVNESLVIAIVCTINCTVLDCWLLSFFSYLLHVILSFYKLSCIEILSLYWSISAFMVYDSNQKDYIQEKRNLFALECVSGISIAYSRLCNEQGMGRIIRTVTVHQVKWGTLASPTWQGTRGDTRDTWPLGPVTTSEQSPGLHPRLWTLSLGTAVCCGA